MKAIQESRTAIIVISRNDASSPSCLNGLATILECFRIECRIIYPIFEDMWQFDLQPSTKNYEEAIFGRLKRRFKHNKEQLQKWRSAFSDAVDMSRGYYCLCRKYLLIFFLSCSPFWALLWLSLSYFTLMLCKKFVKYPFHSWETRFVLIIFFSFFLNHPYGCCSIINK